jgi:superfamily II DNA or RNA helicase
MERRPDVGLDSYDRLFPNQDTLPHGGFGNLIALPLQKGPRGKGNSLFLDDRLEPWTDQWAFLAGVGRISRLQAERVVQEAERRGRIFGVRLPPQEDGDEAPWAAPPSRRRLNPPISAELQPGVELVLGNQIYIAKQDLLPELRNRLLRLAAFQNPEFYQAQGMRLPTYGMPRIIACAEDLPQHIGLPRGCLDDVCRTFRELGVRVTVRDEYQAGRPLGVTFHGEFGPEQHAAAEAMLAHDTGVLAATTAFGKTVVAVWLITQRSVNVLILVHRQQLLDQWVERLSAFFDMPARLVGRIGGGRNKPMRQLDVALIQSLVRKGMIDDRVAEYGHVIVDECHHLSAHSFEQVARQAKARFVLGLSATVARKDGHHPMIFMQRGPVRHRVNARLQAAARPFSHVVLVQPTTFQSERTQDADRRVEFQSLYRDLVSDESRNRRICDDVVESITHGRSPLVLTKRNDHLARLEALLSGRVRHLVVLRAGLGKKQRQAERDRLAGIPSDEARVILATGRLVCEGFDDPRLDTLFLTLPRRPAASPVRRQAGGAYLRLLGPQRADAGADVRSALPRV